MLGVHYLTEHSTSELTGRAKSFSFLLFFLFALANALSRRVGTPPNELLGCAQFDNGNPAKRQHGCLRQRVA